ncbi:efflux RND transporter periplasmic adaptor subunit [Umboniibacter marinipuniceus]|uniref:RND family efflux transporter MFP subunit n=1 Tax=Umboniibacter marinipuniceus TaxID=569599 RepID=A0A3M0A3B3_9GAMM|nr:efflux RND transporter periplasmic adaptor subunit [Umboniibacter marinipuniceus]RMA79473.1 RND family efflux transporter MFP subunit [Umboniibacter marinipuniceus]
MRSTFSIALIIVLSVSLLSTKVIAQRPATAIVQPIVFVAKTERLELTGTIESASSVEIFPAVGDVVTNVYFQAGDAIEAGAPLLQLNNRREQVALELAEINLRDAQRRLDRLKTIHSQAAASQQELDAATLTRDLAANRLAQAQVELDEHTVIAPITGIAGLSDVRVGDRITPSTVITTLDDLDHLFVLIRVPEALTTTLSKGQTFNLTTWGDQTTSIVGTVTDLDSRVDPVTRTLKIRLAIDNVNGLLRPGMSLKADHLTQGQRYASIPEAALLWGASGAYLWTLDNESRAQRRNVEVVQRQTGIILVEGDLLPGEQLIVEGVQRLRSNQVITVVEQP